ncbi:hypothetical protein D915_005904, partial [Fasciola hepatica]
RTVEHTKHKLLLSSDDQPKPLPISQVATVQSAVQLFDEKYNDLDKYMAEYLSYPHCIKVGHGDCRNAVNCFSQVDSYIKDISCLLEMFDSQEQLLELVSDTSGLINRLSTVNYEESQIPTRIIEAHEKLLSKLA